MKVFSLSAATEGNGRVDLIATQCCRRLSEIENGRNQKAIFSAIKSNRDKLKIRKNGELSRAYFEINAKEIYYWSESFRASLAPYILMLHKA